MCLHPEGLGMSQRVLLLKLMILFDKLMILFDNKDINASLLDVLGLESMAFPSLTLDFRVRSCRACRGFV